MKRRLKLRYGRVLAVLVFVLAAVVIVRHRPERVPKKELEGATAVSMSTTEACVTAAEMVQTTAAETTTAVTTTAPFSFDPNAAPYYSAAAVYSVDTGQFLFRENSGAAMAPASLTKMLTAATAVKYAGLDTCYTVGSELWLVYEGSSMAYLTAGDTLTLRDLIAGMLMSSGNDAAYTIAVNVARDQSGRPEMTDYEAVEHFCALMNQTAAEIGMTASHFTTPDGWDSGGQYTTAEDIVKLSAHLMNYPDIMRITGTYQMDVVSVSGEGYSWTNSNHLLDPNFELYRGNVLGMKTGTTLSAGNCLAAAFTKNGSTYISVVAGCYSDYDRFDLTVQLMDAIE